MRPLRSPTVLLGLGLGLLFLTHLRAGVGLLAWLAPIPLLGYLRRTTGPLARLVFVAAMVTAWTLTTMKIVTAPLPFAAAVGFGVPIGLLHALGYLAADAARRRGAPLLFPAIMILVEWVQHRFTPLASWGAAAYTQLGDTPLLQVASIFGMAGVSFLVYAGAAVLESALADAREGRAIDRRPLAVVALAVGVAHLGGTLRLERSLSERAKVAFVGTTATFGAQGMPTDAERAATHEALLADTDAAAKAGAKLVVWTEAAALVLPTEEDAFVGSIQTLAARDHVHVVAAYVVLVRAEPLLYDNELRSVRADGTVAHRYRKHHPVPGEPAIAGDETMEATEVDGVGRVSEAICYDYDFPAIAQAHGALGVDIVALPSSDWRGIDPIHTEMATLRAIEQGTSVIRSTRFGLSAGIDPFGRMVARRSSFESGERVAVFDVPRHGVTTIYRTVGDAFIAANFVGIALSLAFALLRRRQGAVASGEPASSRALPAEAGTGTRNAIARRV